MRAPSTRLGPGVLAFFSGGGKKYENIHYKHHLRLEDGMLAIDGCVFAVWDLGASYTCLVDRESEGETSSE